MADRCTQCADLKPGYLSQSQPFNDGKAISIERPIATAAPNVTRFFAFQHDAIEKK